MEPSATQPLATPQRSWQLPWTVTAWQWIALLSLLLNLVFASLAVRNTYYPFLLEMIPDGETVLVQFSHPGSQGRNATVSPRFRMRVMGVTKPTLIMLDNIQKIPGAEVEFVDTTMFPGRIRLRFGDKCLDVMESRVIVDGKDYDWLSFSETPETIINLHP